MQGAMRAMCEPDFGGACVAWVCSSSWIGSSLDFGPVSDGPSLVLGLMGFLAALSIGPQNLKSDMGRVEFNESSFSRATDNISLNT